MKRWILRLAGAMAVLTALLAALALVNRVQPWWGGLTATNLQGATSWSGWIVGLPPGAYVIRASPGQGVSVAIDGQVIANPLRSVPVQLERGPSRVYVERAAGSAEPAIEYSRDGKTFARLPDDVVFARKPGAMAVAGASAFRRARAAVEWLWVVAWALSGVGVLAAIWDYCRTATNDSVDWRSLRWVLAGSFLLNVVPIWWGLPAIWPADELTPVTVLRGLALHFGHGWFDRWPPLQYYALTAVMSPVLLLNAFGRIDFSTAPWPQILTLMNRSASVVAAAGTLIAVAVAASPIFGRRAGTFAAAIFALAAPFPYYAKTANLDVPYVFWFSLSLVFYLRYLDAVSTRAAVLFGVCATLAICTKDQAYALYPLAALIIGARTWRARGQEGRGRWMVLLDRRLVTGVLASAGVFALCHNLLFNFAGFVEHVRYIVGPGSENYQMFPATSAGRLQLLGLTAYLVKISWGWPLTVVSLAGVAMALATPRWRLISLALLAPIASYYLTFIDVILYNYDRFVLPMTLILAIFGGALIDRLTPRSGRSVWRMAAVGLVFGYTILYAATLDVLMIRDSRYAVSRWAAATLRPGQTIAISGPRELEPAFTVPWMDVATQADLDRRRPDYYVLSADYAKAVSPDTDWGGLIAALQSGETGYRLGARVRCQAPWPWLPDSHPELTGSRSIGPGGEAVSVLRDVNPTLEVYSRDKVPLSLPCPAGLLR